MSKGLTSKKSLYYNSVCLTLEPILFQSETSMKRSFQSKYRILVGDAILKTAKTIHSEKDIKSKLYEYQAFLQWKRSFYDIWEISGKSVTPKKHRKFSNLTSLDVVHKPTLDLRIVVLKKFVVQLPILFSLHWRISRVLCWYFLMRSDAHIKWVTFFNQEIKSLLK